MADFTEKEQSIIVLIAMVIVAVFTVGRGSNLFSIMVGSGESLTGIEAPLTNFNFDSCCPAVWNIQWGVNEAKGKTVDRNTFTFTELSGQYPASNGGLLTLQDIAFNCNAYQRAQDKLAPQELTSPAQVECSIFDPITGQPIDNIKGTNFAIIAKANYFGIPSPVVQPSPIPITPQPIIAEPQPSPIETITQPIEDIITTITQPSQPASAAQQDNTMLYIIGGLAIILSVLIYIKRK